MRKVIRFLVVTSLFVGSAASATIISFSISGANDCVGYYSEGGSGFENCAVFAEDDPNKVSISSIISKFQANSSTGEHSSLFGSGDSDYDIDFGNENWSYTGPDGIKYWVIKAGDGFIVFYDTSDGSCTDTNASTEACMLTANVVTGAEWAPYGITNLSHISFYDSEVRVPEPGTLALFGLGLLGLGARYRARAKA